RRGRGPPPGRRPPGPRLQPRSRRPPRDRSGRSPPPRRARPRAYGGRGSRLIPPEELELVFGVSAASAEYCLPPRVPWEATAGVWRARPGAASAGLKVVRQIEAVDSRGPAAAEPEHPYYWRREPLVYGSGLLERLAGGLRAPGRRALIDRA